MINIEKIDKVITEIVNEFRIQNGIFNLAVREDVFKILEKHCYVVYYPLENEDINGFHILRAINGKREHFVYINTWNTTERQIFTAAHELGHILNVYKQVKDKLPDIDEISAETEDITPEEFVVNKFAAELLMPANVFKQEMEKELEKLNYNGKSISRLNLLKLTTRMMNTFFVGYKATTKRFLEVGKISIESYQIIKDFENSDYFKNNFANILKEGNYKRLNIRPKTRYIKDLSENIRFAEENGCILTSTIASLKNDFNITPPESSTKEDDISFVGGETI